MARPTSTWSDETAYDLFARLSEPALSLPCLPAGLQSGETLELLGEPSTGKTALLMECAARCILPPECDGVRFDGHGAGAWLVDAEGGFSVERLNSALLQRIARASADRSEWTEARAQELADASLQRLRIMRCATRGELLLGLCSLRALLDGESRAAAAAGPPTRLLLIDSLTSFQGVVRAAARLRQGRDAEPAPSGELGFVESLSRVVRSLTHHRLCVAWTRTPDQSHSAGYELPGLSASDGLAGAVTPTHRLRLRRLAAADAPGGAPGVVATFGAVLDARRHPVTPGASAGGPPAGLPAQPARFVVRLSGAGVVAAAT